MVQGEKQSCMTTLASSTSRTSDPAARKASYDALQKMDQSNSKWSSASNDSKAGASSSSFSASAKKTDKDQYGSWGPMFQNKSTFASMHFC